MPDITTIISDIHLGSDVCQAKELERFLSHLEQRSNRLILNGDVFDSIDMRRLKKHHWHVLSQFRKLSDKMEVIWVVGNHDGPAEIVSHLLGLAAADEYEFISGGKCVMVLHGHIFDEFIDSHPILTWMGDRIYSFLQRIDNSHYIARMAKHSSKTYLRCAENIKFKAVKFGKSKRCDIVCCGHTHKAESVMIDSVQYVNSGCWTEKPASFIEIRDGVAKINEFKD